MAFAVGCVKMIQDSKLWELSSQGVANSLWAVAKLKLDHEVAVPFCVEAARVMVSKQGSQNSNRSADSRFLCSFQPQELSMALWACAKIVGRPFGTSLPPQIMEFALAVAEQANIRLKELNSQGLSNLAWAIATLQLTFKDASTRFLLSAAGHSASNLASFPPQAIANMCWALARLPQPTAAAGFFVASAVEARRRTHDFSWQDLAGLVSSMTQAKLAHVPEVVSFAVALVQYCSGEGRCHDIPTQSLLNIALSAARLRIDVAVLTPMAWGVAQAFTNPSRMGRLNDLDLKQWQELQRYCKLPGAAVPVAQSQQSRGARRHGGRGPR